MLWSTLLILAVVGVVVVVAVLLAKDPTANDGSFHLDRFLADARQERPTREEPSRSGKIPSAKPRQRPTQPQLLAPLPEPLVPVIILPVVEPEPDPEPLPPAAPMPPRRSSSPAVERLHRLLRDRDSVQAAFLLNEILRPPVSRRTGRG